MPDVAFNISGDAASLVRTSQEVQSAQEKMEQGWERYARSAEVASVEVQAALREVETYELASASRIDAAVRTSGSGPRRGIRAFELAPAAAAAGQTIIHPGKDVQPLEFAATSGELAANKNYNEWLAREATARENAAKQSALLSESIATSAAADRAAHEVRQSSAARSQLQSDLQSQIALDAFGARQDKVRKDSGHLVAPDWWKNNPEMKDHLAAAATGVGVVAVGMYALGSVVGKVHETYSRVADAGDQFEDQMRQLLSLGNNLSAAPRLREHVLALSGATGLDAGQVASAQFMLQSAASNMTAQQREQIMGAGTGLQQVAGGDLTSNIVAVTKLMQTYGSEMGTADKAASKLLMTEDKAAITLGELSQLLPDVLPAAKLMGHTYDEVASSIITATQVMGNNEKTLTGLRNTFLKLGEAQQEGLVHQGSFLDQLRELSAVDPEALIKVFGDRSVSVVAALAQHTGDIAKNMKEMEAVTGNETFQKFLNRMSDPQARDADIRSGVKKSDENIDIERAKEASLRESDLHHNLTVQGIKLSESSLSKSLLPDSARSLHASYQDLAVGTSYEQSSDSNNDYFKLGLNRQISNLREANTRQSNFEADLLTLRYGGATNTKFSDGKGNTWYSDAAAADEYVEFAKKHPTATLGAFEEYAADTSHGDTKAANAVIARLDAAAKNFHHASKAFGGAVGSEATNTHTE